MRAIAESLPLASRSFDAAMAVLTVHHWPNASAGLAELRRVSRRQVVATGAAFPAPRRNDLTFEARDDRGTNVFPDRYGIRNTELASGDYLLSLTSTRIWPRKPQLLDLPAQAPACKPTPLYPHYDFPSASVRCRPARVRDWRAEHQPRTATERPRDRPTTPLT